MSIGSVPSATARALALRELPADRRSAGEDPVDRPAEAALEGGPAPRRPAGQVAADARTVHLAQLGPRQLEHQLSVAAGGPAALPADARPADAVAAFFAPVRDNVHVDRLVRAGLLPQGAGVTDFYNFKYSLSSMSLGQVDELARRHGMTAETLSLTLVHGSASFGDAAFNVFRSFLMNPGFVGSSFPGHERGLMQAMVQHGLRPEHRQQLFQEMLQIGGYTDEPVNGFANEYEYKKAVTAWTQGLGATGNVAGPLAPSSQALLQAARRAALAPRPVSTPLAMRSLTGGDVPMDAQRLQQIIAALERQGVAVVHGPEGQRMARALGGEALYIPEAGRPGIMVFGNNPSRTAVAEELLHLGQHRRLDWAAPAMQDIARLEIQAQQRLLEVGRRIGWSSEELSRIERALAEWTRRLQQGGG